jgi:colicin import membrane protein
VNQTLPVTLDNPVAVLTDPKTYSEFYARIKAEVSSHVPDLTTERGRKEIARVAYKVTRSKTAIDDAGKKLNEEARAKINAVDAQRRKIREELDALAEEVRKPLTEWEKAEDQRIADKEAQINEIKQIGAVSHGETAADIKARWDRLNLIIIRDDVHLDNADAARALVDSTLDNLERLREVAAKAEADAAELARLREEAERREAAERAAKAAAEAERIATERAEREAAEAKAREEAAAQRAREEAERVSKAENERIEREAREAVAKAEAEARRVTEAAERAERERQEAEDRTKREEAARQADREHRGKVMGEAKSALIEIGAAEDLAKKIVLAIVAGEIPHVSLRF